MDKPLQILLVEDVATDAELIEIELEGAGIHFTSKRADSRQRFVDLLNEFQPDVIISDYSLPSFNALEALKIKNERHQHIPFILVTGAQTEEVAVNCIKKGADDYILKSSLTRLPTSILNALNKKQAEKENIRSLEQIKAREEKYRNLFENSLVGMFRATLEGCRFIEANDKAKSILGVKEIEGIHFKDFNFCNETGDLVDMISDQNERVENFEVEIIRPDKTSAWISISARLYPSEGIIEGVIHDITQTKNSLIELEKANYELDRFAYHASHDLRSPLRSLEGLIKAAFEEDSLDEIRVIMKMMERSTKKLDMLISDLLVLAQNKKSEARIVSIDFRQELQECLAHLSFMENFSRININHNISQETIFHSDAVRLRIILNNIISNAIKYHQLDQDNPFIFIDIAVTEEKACIKIEDNGSGIAQKHLDKIFDMFYRASNSSEGSGLGLFLVKSTMEKLQGNIHVESQHLIGTSFLIEIPNSLTPAVQEQEERSIVES